MIKQSRTLISFPLLGITPFGRFYFITQEAQEAQETQKWDRTLIMA